MKLSRLAFILSLMASLSASAADIHLSSSGSNESERVEFIALMRTMRETRTPEKLQVRAQPSWQDMLGSLTGMASAVSDPGAWDAAYERADKNGDMYMLWGNLDNAWTEKEYDRFYSISKWLVKHKFRNIINPVAYVADVREAVTNPRTAGILWSSHGAVDGTIFDSDQAAVPTNAFALQASPSFRHLVLSNCYSDQTVANYELPQGLTAHHWTGETTTDEFFSYLISEDWDRDLERDLQIQFN